MRESGKRNAGRAQPRARSATPKPSAFDDEAEHYKSFSLYCEVKLQESKRGLENGQRDRRVVDLCFKLLHKAAGLSSTIAAPLQSIIQELEDAVFSDVEIDPIRKSLTGALPVQASDRKPFFEISDERTVEIDRLRQNHAHMQKIAAPERPREAEGRAAKAMVDSRLMHLESDMHHMLDRLQTGEQTASQLSKQLENKTKLAKDLHDTNETLRFELEGMQRTLDRVEAAREHADEKFGELFIRCRQLQLISWARLTLFCWYGAERLYAQVGEVAAPTGTRAELEECKAELRAAERAKERAADEAAQGRQERARLAYRVQELKKLLLTMVPRDELDEAMAPVVGLKADLEQTHVELQSTKRRNTEMEGRVAELNELMPFMTPRPDWSQIGAYTDVEDWAEDDSVITGESSRDHVTRLFQKIDDIRGPAAAAKAASSPKRSPVKPSMSAKKASLVSATEFDHVPAGSDVGRAAANGPGTGSPGRGLDELLQNALDGEEFEGLGADESIPEWLRWKGRVR